MYEMREQKAAAAAATTTTASADNENLRIYAILDCALFDSRRKLPHTSHACIGQKCFQNVRI